MAGIYIHIPYCKQACHYCNFHFSTATKNKGRLLNALAKEIAMRKDYLAGERVNTIYFGGGTPSLLSSAEIDKIMELLQRHYVISPDSEITLEANPDDILKKGYLSSLKQAGINRLSIGVQSFSDKDLCYMNRAHCGVDALNAIEKSQSAGFENSTPVSTETLPNQ